VEAKICIRKLYPKEAPHELSSTVSPTMQPSSIINPPQSEDIMETRNEIRFFDRYAEDGTNLVANPAFQCPNKNTNVTCVRGQMVEVYREWNVTVVNGRVIKQDFIQFLYCCNGTVESYIDNIYLRNRNETSRLGVFNPDFQCPKLSAAVICQFGQTIDSYSSWNVTTVDGRVVDRIQLDNLYCCNGMVESYVENIYLRSRNETNRLGVFNPDFQCPSLNSAVICQIGQTIDTYSSWNVTSVNGKTFSRVRLNNLFCCNGTVESYTYIDNIYLRSRNETNRLGVFNPDFQCPKLSAAVICQFGQNIDSYSSWNVTTVNGRTVSRVRLANSFCCNGTVETFIVNEFFQTRNDTRKSNFYNPNFQCPKLSAAVVCLARQLTNIFKSFSVTTVNGMEISKKFVQNLFCCD
jgi:hypothetical protein